MTHGVHFSSFSILPVFFFLVVVVLFLLAEPGSRDPRGAVLIIFDFPCPFFLFLVVVVVVFLLAEPGSRHPRGAVPVADGPDHRSEWRPHIRGRNWSSYLSPPHPWMLWCCVAFANQGLLVSSGGNVH